METKKQTTETVKETEEKKVEEVVKEEKKVTETVAEKPAEKPVEKSAEKPVTKTAKKTTAKSTTKKTAEKTAEQKAEKPAEQKAEEKAEPSFVADCKDKQPKEFASLGQIAARYGDEQALNILRKKIAQYKEVHFRFLKKMEEPNAFKMEKLYVPVYCGKTDVRYSWKTTANKVETTHEEICTKEKRFSNARQDLDVTNFLPENVKKAEAKKETELVENDANAFKKTARQFNAWVKSTAPAKKSSIEKRDESYTLVYVPVMKTTCTLDGKKYIGYVNLYNGACYSDYKVSDVVEKAAEKADLSARFAKRSLWGTFLFSLTFCLLTMVSALKLVDWSFGDLTVDAVWVTCVLAALSLPSIVLMIGLNTIKKDALIEKAVRTNKLPSTAWARFASVLGVLCAIASVLLFFFQVMI